jgi:3-hydroxyisobutyrate dehydrogenase
VIGFLGLGVMGLPMARNLDRAGTPLVVWNRSAGRYAEIPGASVATDPGDVLARCDTVLMMLQDDQAIDATLGRDTRRFGAVCGKTIVHMGTTSPEYSTDLGRAVEQAGGRYVEAPVSGSRGPAETGDLIMMLAGRPQATSHVRSLAAPMCREIFECGPVPNALLMKLAINTFLITMVTGLAEAYHLADRFGLDRRTFVEVLDAGPMASRVSARKSAKLLAADFAVEAGLVDVYKNNRLITDAARARDVAAPLMAVCRELYREVVEAGHGAQDMAAVLHAIAARTDQLTA